MWWLLGGLPPHYFCHLQFSWLASFWSCCVLCVIDLDRSWRSYFYEKNSRPHRQRNEKTKAQIIGGTQLIQPKSWIDRQLWPQDLSRYFQPSGTMTYAFFTRKKDIPMQFFFLFWRTCLLLLTFDLHDAFGHQLVMLLGCVSCG